MTDLYRGCFVNLGRIARLIREIAPGARDILEIGCGEGALLERLARAYPAARLTGIDITPTVGRLFRGDVSPQPSVKKRSKISPPLRQGDSI